MTDSPTRKRKTKKKLNWKKVATSLVVVILIVCLGMGCFFAWSVYKETDDFSAKKLLSGEASKMYDINGELMYTFGSDTNGKRENVTYEDLPQVLIDAVVAAEDSRFFEHNGFDLPRIAKTMITNLAHLSIRGGGSTITQQVIKKSYFPKEEQTYTRKLSEIILAIQATKEISKEEIITLYLNKIYFGRSTSSIGIAAASKYYFNKDVSQLTLPEAALLAGTLNSPSAYDPYYNLEKATQRRATVLNLMVDHGYITQEECDLAKQVKVENTLSQGITSSDDALAAYVDIVTKEVKEKTGLDPAETQMNIYTYCNQEVQKMATAMANGETYKYSDEDMQMGGSVQSTQDGRIIAVIGGHNYKSGDLNKATVKQQPGSSMKPLLDYGLAYKYLNWSTVNTVKDEPLTLGGKTIKNWDGQYHGSMSISDALLNSWNIPAITTFQEVKKAAGSDAIIKDMESVGIDMSDQDKELSDTYAIGGWKTGVSPVELAGAYATIANNGNYIESHTINYVEVVETNKTVKIDEELQKNVTQSIGEDVSFMIRETMLSYSSSTTGSYSSLSGLDNVGAKTGTSNWDSTSPYVKAGKSRDLWMTAYTPDYTCSVWMGFDTTGIKKGKNTSDYKAYPAKVVAELLKYLQKNTTDKKSYPEQPSGVEQIQVVAGTYDSPTANTPASQILTGWAKTGYGPTTAAKDPEINTLSAFEASINGNGKIDVSFTAYEPANPDIVYVVEIYDESNNLLYSTKLTTNSGTIDYAPTGKVKVVGYYAYSSGSPTSNKIEKTIGSSAKLDKVNYSITSGGSSVTNGSTTATSSVAIKVNAQSSSNTITIQFMNSSGGTIGSPSTFTGSATKEFALTPGAQYTVKITESDGTKTVSASISFTVGGNSNPGE